MMLLGRTIAVNRCKIMLLSLVCAGLLSPARAAEPRHPIHFPALEGYQTVACDFHMHTVFSDGEVWPPVRVQEAWRQGLDVIAITDHIEYQPHRADVPTHFDRSYELARATAAEHGILLARGAEITRSTPPGHFNAVFLDDIAPLDTADLSGGHEASEPAGSLRLLESPRLERAGERAAGPTAHATMYANKWLHGIEVCNGDTYYPQAHRWCLEKNLTMMGNSDIHDPDLRTQSTPADHRTVTLAFVKEKTLSGVKEALQQGRTVVWWKDRLIGRREWLAPLFAKCVRVSSPHLRSAEEVWVKIGNVSDVDVRLKRVGDVGPLHLNLPARATTLVAIAAQRSTRPLDLRYTAENFLIEPQTGLPVVLTIAGP